VRAASAADAGACAAIYAPYVEQTAVTFELEAPTAQEMAVRIDAARDHAWLVLEDAGAVVGYAYGGVVYVEMGRLRTGAGRALYEALLALLARRGYRKAIAGMTLPNESSVGLHLAMGFEPVGTYRDIGYKLGRWHDVAWMQAPLGDDLDPPPEPR
jgi:phosphinothricin acetyltransferase